MEDFSSYSSAANFLSDPSGIYDSVESVLTNTYGAVTLDQTVGYGGSTQSMRYDYFDASNEPSTSSTGHCTNGGHGVYRVLKTPAGTKQLWVEYWLKFSTNFSFGGPASWGCASAPEQKLLTVGVMDPSTSRFNLEVTDQQWVFGYPDNETAYVSSDAPLPSSLFDGQWHRVRMALGVSSAPGTADGFASLWIDNALRSDMQNVVVNRSEIFDLWVGQTRNQGAGSNMSIWWGGITTWTTNPGW